MSDPLDPNPSRHTDDPAVPGDGQPADLPPGKRPRKRRWLRRTLWGIGVLLVLLIVLVAIAPTLLSTGPGTSVAENIGGGFVNGKLELEGLSVGWFSGTKVDGLSIEDEQGIRVVEVANFSSGLTLWEALRQDFDLGQTTGRVNLPRILVYEDGTTNLHEVFGIEPSAEESQEPMPQVAGDIKLDGMLNVQYVGNPDTAADDSKAVDVDFTGTRVVLQPGQPLEHNLPLDLRVDGADAGQVAVVGTVDLDSLSAARPVIKEEITLTNLQLPALGTLLTAFIPAMTDYELAGGVIGGTLTADLESNTLGGQITGSERIVVARRDAGGQGYETDRFELAVNGTFTEAELATSDQVTLEDGTVVAVRRSVDLDRLSVTTDDGTVTAAAILDLFLLQTDPMANWPMLARDVTLDLKTDFATAQGGGANLGAFELNATADLAKVNEKFGTLASAGGVQATEGTARINLKTQQAPSGEVTIPLEANIENPTLVQAEPPAEAQAASAVVSEPAVAARQREPGRISQDPPAAPTETAATQPVGPLRLGLIRLVASATLPAPAKDAAMGLSNLAADFAVNDRDQQAIVTGRVSAADLTADATGGRLALENLALPDYTRLRQALGAWAPLPEESQPIEPITMSAVASYDGAAKAISLAEPLRILIGQAELAVVNLAARQEQEGQWVIPDLSAVVQVPPLDAFLAKLGEETAQREEAQGQVTVRVVKDRPIQLATADIAGTLQGALEVVLEGTAARGMTVSGTLPVHLRGTSAAVPRDARPLEVNGGTVALAGSTLDQVNQQWILRPRMAVNNVSMNPVLLEAAGKFVNPVFVDAEAAAGLLDVKLSGSDTLNLSDPFGSGTSMAMEFNIRELNISNDIVAQFTEAALGETVGTLRQQLSAVPGLGQQLSAFNLSEEIKEDISSIRGNIMNAKVSLKDGVASTNVTFNVADPRVEAAQDQPLYPLAFAGGVNLKTLEAVDMNVTVPRVLIEKWVGENPDDLVKYFGQNPWQKLLPDGVRLKITGTMYVPLPDPLSLQTMAREVGTRAAKAAIQGGVEDALRRGLGDLLKGGKEEPS